MSHFLRLAVLSVLVFTAMSAYLLMPAPGDIWDRSKHEEVACAQGRPRLSIFMASTPVPGRAEGVPSRFEEDSSSVSPSSEAGGARPRDLPWVEPGQEGGAATPAIDPGPAPAPPADRVYEVKRGDTLSEIAARMLGSVRYGKDILKRNPQVKNGNDLKVGQKLILPLEVSAGNGDEESEPGPAPEPAERERTGKDTERSYREIDVKPGDTLFAIAKSTFGDGNQWRRLLALNKDRITEDGPLAVGTKLRVPVKSKVR